MRRFVTSGISLLIAAASLAAAREIVSDSDAEEFGVSQSSLEKSCEMMRRDAKSKEWAMDVDGLARLASGQ
jgi:hypothetical protein